MKRLITCAILLFSTTLLWANGGPVIEFSSLTLSRTPVAKHIPEVQLINEHLTFTPMGRYTQVEVRYKLLNQSDKSFRDIPYGFPIDYYGSGPCHTEMWDQWDGDGVPQTIGWSDGYIRDVSFNGNLVAHQCSADTIIRPRRSIKDYPRILALDSLRHYWEYIDSNELIENALEYSLRHYEKQDKDAYECEISRRWYYTHLTIASHQEVELVVRYRQFNYGSINDDFYGDIFNSLDRYYGFSYDFSPAAYWGNGKVNHIEVDVNTLYYNTEVQILPYTLTRVSPTLLRWSGDDISLAQLEPLKLSFYARHRLWPHYRRQRLSPDKYVVSLSCADAKYPIENLSDTNAATTAVIHPDGKGRTHICIRLNKPQVLAGLVVVGGYGKSVDTWANNSRIKSLKIVVYDENGKPLKEAFPWKDEWKPSGSLYDDPPSIKDPLDLHVLTRDYACIEIPLSQDTVWQFPNGIYSIVDSKNMTIEEELRLFDDEDSPIPYPFTLGRHKISEIHLQVMEQYPGRKYQDLCISEIIVLGDK